MLLKQLGIMFVTTALLMPVGCRKDESDERLLEVAVKVEKQEAKIDGIAQKVEGIEGRLDEMQASLRKIAESSGPAELAKGVASQVVDFRETPEYKKIVAALSDIQQRLKLTESDVAEMEEGLVKELEDERRRNPAHQYDPKEMTKRLDALLENFVQKIEDPLQRQEFEADVERLRQINSDKLSTQEVRDWLISDLTQRLEDVQHEGTRKWIEWYLGRLESASGYQLRATLRTVRDAVNFWALAELKEKYGTRPWALENAGLLEVDLHSWARNFHALVTELREATSVGLTLE